MEQCVVFLYVVLLGVQLAVQGAMVDVKEECCSRGTDLAKGTRGCTDYASPIPNIDNADQDSCRRVLEVCCVQELQRHQCSIGVASARSGETCAMPTINELGREDYQECCHCCNLGMTAKRETPHINCQRISNLGNTCNAAFIDCCVNSIPEIRPTEPPEEDNMDECALFPNQLCEHTCINTPGSFLCVCDSGYVLQSDGRTCKEVLVTCADNPSPCQQICEDNGRRGVLCSCNEGYKLAENNRDCEILDTCDTFDCEQRCIDTIQGAQCQCDTGFQLSIDGKTCEDVDECLYGTHSCPNDHTCVNYEGYYRCERVIRCSSGLQYNSDTGTCEDINECVELNNPCSGQLQLCRNTEGSYECYEEIRRCGTGYRLNDQTGLCEDIDECAESDDPCSGQRCVNFDGSFSCEQLCDAGYIFNQQLLRCQDMDECLNDPCGDDICVNLQGGYRCDPVNTCPVGYEFSVRSQRCIDTNECAIGENSCEVGQRCVNTVGSYQCQRIRDCGTGYTLTTDNNCIDNDECELRTHNCRQNQICKNIQGSFRCEDIKDCDLGLRLDRSGNCVDINECDGNPCPRNARCYNTIGSYRCNPRIQCGSGLELDVTGTRCQDIDECSRGTDECQADQTCQNTQGGYNCVCPTGYEINQFTNTCQDKDECSEWKGRCNQICENTPGSYRCQCNDGYKLAADNFLCTDVNECEQPDVCEQQCVNYYGSYSCMCSRGYRLSTDGSGRCNDIDECTIYSAQGSLCMGICNNVPGSFKCSCPPGYNLAGDKRSCRDIDECITGTDTCLSSESCFNTRGSFKCHSIECPQYFIKTAAARCRRQRCAIDDTVCLKLPFAISFNYLTFPIGVRTPARLFSMTAVPYRTNTYDFLLVKGNEANEFRLQKERLKATVFLIQPITEAGQVEIELEMRSYDEGMLAGKNLAKIIIYVTPYKF